MITWMQKHKRWLVVTIWISTIAFVGAGFVGWGSYDYGSKGGVVAKVGSREVSVEEYQQEYSNLYSEYARMFGSSFNQELADQLRLKDTAFRQVLEKNLIMAYGNSIDFEVTDEEIAKEVLKYEVFHKDGKFDKNTYIQVLNQNRMSPQEFENGLKNSILFQKTQNLFIVDPSAKEIENISKLLFLEDDIVVKVLSLKDVSVQIIEDDMKKFWEENKNSYMSEISYALETKKLAVISANSSDEDIKNQYDKFKSDYKFEDGKIKSLEEAKDQIIKDLDEKFTKKEALTLYLQLKKDEEKFEKEETFLQSQLPFTSENIEKIDEVKNGEIVKPFYENGNFYIVKLVNKKASAPLAYEDALSSVKIDFENSLKSKKLDELANSKVKDFEGTEVLGVNRESISKIPNLNQQDAANFLNQLFMSSQKEGVIRLQDKAVLYKITDSRMANYDSTKDDLVKGTIINVQESDLISNLLKKLETMFTIKSSLAKE